MLLPFHLNRRARGYLHRVVGAVALFSWLFVAGAEYCPPLHAWLHGGAIPDDDDCPVVMVAAGHVDTLTSEVQMAMPVIFIEITPREEVTVFVPSEKTLPNDRAPPLFCT
jgi:hypothetical protein